MTPILTALAILFSVLLAGVTFVQVLYLESLRLRSRDLPALEFFKETLKDRLGLKAERGALAFSLLKHTAIAFIGVLMLALTSRGFGVSWQTVLEAFLGSWLILLTAGYGIPQILYRKTEGRWVLPFVPDLTLGHENRTDRVDLLRRGPRRDGNLPGVQGHMALLDPFGSKRADGGEVLRQADSGDHLGKLARGLDPH